MLNLSIPEHIQPLRARVLGFIEQEVYPLENELLENKCKFEGKLYEVVF